MCGGETHINESIERRAQIKKWKQSFLFLKKESIHSQRPPLSVYLSVCLSLWLLCIYIDLLPSFEISLLWSTWEITQQKRERKRKDSLDWGRENNLFRYTSLSYLFLGGSDTIWLERGYFQFSWSMARGCLMNLIWILLWSPSDCQNAVFLMQWYQSWVHKVAVSCKFVEMIWKSWFCFHYLLLCFHAVFLRYVRSAWINKQYIIFYIHEHE